MRTSRRSCAEPQLLLEVSTATESLTPEQRQQLTNGSNTVHNSSNNNNNNKTATFNHANGVSSSSSTSKGGVGGTGERILDVKQIPPQLMPNTTTQLQAIGKDKQLTWLRNVLIQVRACVPV